jgi:hypothetical protein
MREHGVGSGELKRSFVHEETRARMRVLGRRNCEVVNVKWGQAANVLAFERSHQGLSLALQ